MARLRLFADLREAAGTPAADLPGGTVGEVLAGAVDRFGADFERGLGSAHVWVNGEDAGLDTRVGDGDEVALLPPVSGGTSVVRSPALLEIGLVAVIAAALVIANEISLQWLASTVVVAGSVWAWDLGESAAQRDVPIGAVPVVAAVTAGVLASYRFGIPGLAAACVGAVVGALVWAIFTPRLRPIESVAATVSAALVGAFGSGALVVLRLRSRDEVLAFLLVAAVSVAAMWATSRADLPGIDPLVVGLVAALAAGAAGGAIWGDDLWPILIASAGAALALIAGRNLGSLIRAGGFYLVEPVPGSLHYFDGVLMAAGPFWLILSVIA